MKERPILFQAAMVRAILTGTKTQTRRVVKPQPETRPGMHCTRLIFKDRKGTPLLDEALEAPEPVQYRSLCPYGQPGDRLWVREAWRADARYDWAPPREVPQGSRVFYEADDHANWHEDMTCPPSIRKRPSIHMPRWASRIALEVTNVRVELLQDISEADAQAEGVYTDPACPAYDGYRDLWERINSSGSWDANPWVWVVEFRRIIDE